MLVLTRKLGESIAIDDHIRIRVVQIKGKQVRLGIEAPKETKIHREEVYLAIQEANKQSLATSSAGARKASELLLKKGDVNGEREQQQAPQEGIKPVKETTAGEPTNPNKGSNR
ncbi:MAG: carbon storage regulator CsrA [Bdellovibrionaceae bacterium]|nr:carbon storage regulator CsrA [Pseudobdellovibrionaceae bacterium]MDW8191089.1 carbon storage regulator CsrA [Pseudobdellovibrionaceae bacterium]